VRRILASLFVIGALLAGGVFATGAYFQFQGAGPSFQIVTGTATLTATPVGGTLGSSPLVVGPGFALERARKPPTGGIQHRWLRGELSVQRTYFRPGAQIRGRADRGARR